MNELSRRRFGVIAVTAPVWATPIVRSVSVAGASQAAGMGSRPPARSDFPTNNIRPKVTSPVADPVDPMLPYTGDNEMPVAAVGAAAVAAGAALIVVAKKRRGDRFGPCNCG